jgi:hypothetical protein
MSVRHPTFSCLVHLLLMYGGTSFVTSFSTTSFLNSRCFHGISSEQGNSRRILRGACYYEFMSKTTTTTTSLQATWSNGQGKQVKK